MAPFLTDWRKRYTGKALAIVKPASTREVSEVVKLCAAVGVAIVPQGGNTGLAGGATPDDSGAQIVLNLSRMNRVRGVDPINNTLTVEAGCTLAAVQQAAHDAERLFPLSLAAEGSCEIGGNLSTNAGGTAVLRYGNIRELTLGLEVVLASGDVWDGLRGLRKNNTGYDLKQLFIGAEGTLGIITAATLKLAKIQAPARVMLLSVSSLAAVLALFRDAREADFTLNAYEFFTRECLERLLRHRNVRDPFDGKHSHYVLIEIDGDSDEARVMSWVARVLETGLATDGVMAQHAQQAAELWGLREGISESLSATGLPHKNDIALPISKLEAFCAELDGVFALRYPSWEIALFGHIGDGNLHVNVMKPDSLTKQEFLDKTHEVDRHMFDLVKSHDGSISAEHGIGLLKRDFLSWSRSAGEIALMHALKRTLDPKGIMNPGKIWPLHEAKKK